jgi:hypothetical protein
MSCLDILKDFILKLLAPTETLSVYKWAEKFIYLSERVGALPGQFSTILTPYLREPLQCFADKTVTDLTCCFGTQSAKTTLVMIGVGYKIVNDSMSAVWVMPNENLAKSFSKTRWIPMVNDCGPLCAQKPKSRHLFGFLEQHFAKVTLNFVGSNSAANLASRPAGLLAMDETDKFKLENDREAGALQLAEERTKTFPFPLRVKTSTPTTVHGEIWREFLLGDRRYYNVPCPHCSKVDPTIEGKRYEELTDEEKVVVATYIVLKFSVHSEVHGDCGIRWWRESEDESKTDGEWDYEKVKHNAFYKCQRCGGEILNDHKPEMLRAGIWVPTNPNAERSRRSYHLSSLYSLLGPEVTFPAIAVKWLQTKGSLTKRHNFINSMLAETWDDEKAVDDNPIFKEDYGREVVPSDRTVIMTVDLQHNHFWVLVRAFAPPSLEKPSGESWLLFADKVEGGIEEVVSIQREYEVESKNVVLDIAHFTNQACRWLTEYDWRGMWGSDKNGFLHTLENGQRLIKHWSTVNYRDPHLGTKFAAEVNRKAMFVYWAHEPIYDMLAVLRFSEPAIFHIHSDVPAAYQKHLNSAIKTTKKSFKTGRVTYFWKQLRKEDHLRDCECMALVRALQLGLVPMPDEMPTTKQSLLDLGESAA